MKAAKRYAKALFEWSVNDMEAVQKDMQLILDTFKAHPELNALLKNPLVETSKKKGIVTQIFGNKLTDYSQKLIELLAQKDRLSLLKNIAVSFNELYKENKGIKEANVVSAVPLTDALKDSILEKIKTLTGSNHIKLTNTVDPKLIGGFVLNMDDLRYDASVSGKLAKIKSKLVE